MKTNIPLGILLIILSELSFTFLWAGVKLSTVSLPVFEVMFFRSLFATAITAILMIAKKKSFKINNRRLMFGRSFIGFLAMATSFHAFSKINLGDATTLVHTSPIFVAILSPFLIKEKSGKWLMGWILVAFTGVILITRPDAGIFQNAAIIALASGFLSGIAFITLRPLSLTDDYLAITFYFLVFCTLASIPFIAVNFKMPNAYLWTILVSMGIFGTIAQIFLTLSYKMGPANILTPFNNMAVVFAFILGYIAWGETPLLREILGALFIIISVAFISIYANRSVAEEVPEIGEG